MPRKKSRPRRQFPPGRPQLQGLLLEGHEWIFSPYYNNNNNHRYKPQHQGVHDVTIHTEESRATWSAWRLEQERQQQQEFIDDGSQTEPLAKSCRLSSKEGDKENEERRLAASPRITRKRRRSLASTGSSSTRSLFETAQPAAKRPGRSRSNPLPRIGRKFQVDSIPAVGDRASKYARYTPIWDPTRATPAVWDWLDNRRMNDPRNHNQPHDPVLAMQALHESNYDVHRAQEWLDNHVQQKIQQRTIEADDIPRVFELSQMAAEKDFGKIARQFGTTVSQILVHYYRWKGSDPEAYQRTFKSKEADDCAICRDGGYLMVCSGNCRRAFHPDCVQLEKVPAGDWFCSDCQASNSKWKGRMVFCRLDADSYLLNIPVTPDKGLGLIIREINGKPTLQKVRRHDAPEDVRAGDVIIAVDDVSIQGITYGETMSLLCNHQGRNMRMLTFYRPDSQNNNIERAVARPKMQKSDIPADADIIEIDDMSAGADVIEIHDDSSEDGRDDCAKSKPDPTDAKQQPVPIVPFSMEVLNDSHYLLRMPVSTMENGVVLTTQGGHVVLESIGFGCTSMNTPLFGDRLVAVNTVRVHNLPYGQVEKIIQEFSQGDEYLLRFFRPNGGLTKGKAFAKAGHSNDFFEEADYQDSGICGEGSGSDQRILVLARSDGLYELHIPVTSSGGLGIQVANFSGKTVFNKFMREAHDPHNVYPKEGDVFVSIDYQSVENTPYIDVIPILKTHHGRSKRVAVLKRAEGTIAGRKSKPRSVATVPPFASLGVQRKKSTTNSQYTADQKSTPGEKEVANQAPKTSSQEDEAAAPAAANNRDALLAVASTKSQQLGNSNEPAAQAYVRQVNEIEYELVVPRALSQLDLSFRVEGDRVYFRSTHTMLLSEASPKNDDPITMIDGVNIRGMNAQDLSKLVQQNASSDERVIRFQRSPDIRIVPSERMQNDASKARVYATRLSDFEYLLRIPIILDGCKLRLRKQSGSLYLKSLDSAIIEGDVIPQNGDRILEIDCVDVSTLSVEEALDALSNNAGRSERVVRLCHAAKARDWSTSEYELELPVSKSGLGILVKESLDKLFLAMIKIPFNRTGLLKPKEGDEIVCIDGESIEHFTLVEKLTRLKWHGDKKRRVLRLRVQE